MRVKVQQNGISIGYLKTLLDRAEKSLNLTVFQIIPVNRDFTGNVYRLTGHFDFFNKYFYECFYIFKLFHTERHFCSFTEIHNY